MTDVQVGCGFVEQEDLGFLCKSTCQHDPLVLSRRQFIEGPHGKVTDVHHVQDLPDHLHVLMEVPFPIAVGVATHEDRVHNGQGEGVVGGIWNVTYLLGQFPYLDVLYVLFIDEHGSACGFQDPVHAVDQCGLTHSVGTYYRYQLGIPDVEGHPFERHVFVTVREVDVVNNEMMNDGPPDDYIL